MNQQIKLNERASLNRPTWTSEPKTGNLEAYKHLHIGKLNQPIVENYYIKTEGLIR